MPSEKELKAAAKEGGKKGQDLAGMSDIGGIRFFTVAMEQCAGDFDLLYEAMANMNKEVDETAEERKGGAGELGKILLSENNDHVAVLCNVPQPLHEKLTPAEWMKSVLEAVGGEILTQDECNIKAIIKGDAEKQRFPLKLRETAISASFALLKSKMLILDDSDDDDTNYAEAAGIEW
eukprot:m.41531 g.41531  ORF g.41531 m.41531 type:complete len:178 (+) comp12012_c0_seq1:64-597(+)